MKRAQQYMMKLTVDALKLRFQRYEVPVLVNLSCWREERKRSRRNGCLHSKRNIFTACGALYHTLAIAKQTSRMRSSCSLPRRGPHRPVASRRPPARNVALRKVKPPQYQRGGRSPTSSAPVRSKFTNSIPTFSFGN